MSALHRSESKDHLLGVDLNDPIEILVKTDQVKSGPNYAKVTCQIELIPGRDSLESNNTGILVFIKSDLLLNGLRPGDKIWLLGKLNKIEPARLPFEVDWSVYYLNKGIYYTMFIKSPTNLFIIENQQVGVQSLAYNLAENIKGLIEKNHWTNHTKQIVKAMLLGDKDEMSVELKDAFSKSGVIHVLAVSGLHVGIIFLFVRSILLMLGIGKNHLFIYTVILIMSIWFYAFVTGLAASVTRASFMFSLITFGEVLRRKSSIYNTIACSAFFILLINPTRLFDLGFLLSYTAVLGIVSIFPILKLLVYNENIFIEKIWSALSVSISAQIGTLPIILKTFNVFPVYFLAANLIAIPLTGVIVVFSLVHTFIQSIPFLNSIASMSGSILEFLINFLSEILSYISLLPYSTIDVSLNDNQFLLLSTLICLITYSFYRSRRNIFIISLYLLPLICLFSDGGPFSKKDNNLTYFINYKNNLFLGKLDGQDHILLPLTEDSLIIDEVSDKTLSYFRKKGIPLKRIIYPFNNNESRPSLMEITINEEKHLLITKSLDDSTLSEFVGKLNYHAVIFTEYPDSSAIYELKNHHKSSIILPSRSKTHKFGNTLKLLNENSRIWQPEYKDYMVLLNPIEE